MIVTGDIVNILYQDVQKIGIVDIYREGNIPEGEIVTERINIFPKELTPDKFWKKSFVEINLCVPDVNGVVNEQRLTELERIAYGLLDDVVGMYDDTRYCYSIEEIGHRREASLKCHYVYCKILFKILNVKKL